MIPCLSLRNYLLNHLCLLARICCRNNQRQPIRETEKIIALHRGQMLKELIQVFAEESIMKGDLYFKVIFPDGNLEKAVDDGGVLRDVLSEFGMTSMSSATWEMDSKCHTYIMNLVNKKVLAE